MSMTSESTLRAPGVTIREVIDAEDLAAAEAAALAWGARRSVPPRSRSLDGEPGRRCAGSRPSPSRRGTPDDPPRPHCGQAPPPRWPTCHGGPRPCVDHRATAVAARGRHAVAGRRGSGDRPRWADRRRGGAGVARSTLDRWRAGWLQRLQDADTALTRPPSLRAPCGA